MNDRTSFRLASALIFSGELLFIAAGVFHPDRVPANQHPEVVAEYWSVLVRLAHGGGR